jgi:glutamate-5-semialdehyde dehydrogenase
MNSRSTNQWAGNQAVTRTRASRTAALMRAARSKGLDKATPLSFEPRYGRLLSREEGFRRLDSAGPGAIHDRAMAWRDEPFVAPKFAGEPDRAWGIRASRARPYARAGAAMGPGRVTGLQQTLTARAKPAMGAGMTDTQTAQIDGLRPVAPVLAAETVESPEVLIARLARAGRAAQAQVARLTTAQKGQALRAAAQAMRDAAGEILAANALDMQAGAARGLTSALLDRLRLDEGRLAGVADAVEEVAGLADPVGQVIDSSTRPNGLALSRVRVPIGLIGIIYESRPNVTADAAALCLASGNAALLRGGSEAAQSNRAIMAAFQKGLAAAGVPAEIVQLVPTQDRAAVGAMLAAQGLIDMIVPRGGKSLVERVQNDARVPVLAHLDGLNHTYVHASADVAMARAVVVNAKLRRTGVCGAMETLLIDAAFPAAQALVADLLAAGCEVRGDARARALDPRILPASDEDWDTEYLEAVVSVAIVDGLEAALAHIDAHSSRHTDAILTGDDAVAEAFLARVDSAIVMVNASSQFADGGEFGLGAEIGIATGRLHARGPVALEGLTTYKWLVRGTGQVRP